MLVDIHDAKVCTNVMYAHYLTQRTLGLRYLGLVRTLVDNLVVVRIIHAKTMTRTSVEVGKALVG